MANLNYDIVDAMKLLEIPEEEHEKYSELVLK